MIHIRFRYYASASDADADIRSYQNVQSRHVPRVGEHVSLFGYEKEREVLKVTHELSSTYLSSVTVVLSTGI